MLLPALFVLSIAYVLAFPIAALAIVASIVSRALDGVEVAVVVSRRSKVGAKGQRVIGSIRLNRASLTRTGGAALDLTGRAALAVRSTATAAARAADGQADRAGALALTLAVWLAPWALVEAAAGAGYAVTPYAIALAIGGAWIRAARPSVAALVTRSEGPVIGR
jgi:hypothetical protein